jgi:hypothetical protein
MSEHHELTGTNRTRLVNFASSGTFSLGFFIYGFSKMPTRAASTIAWGHTRRQK